MSDHKAMMEDLMKQARELAEGLHYAHQRVMDAHEGLIRAQLVHDKAMQDYQRLLDQVRTFPKRIEAGF